MAKAMTVCSVSGYTSKRDERVCIIKGIQSATISDLFAKATKNNIDIIIILFFITFTLTLIKHNMLSNSPPSLCKSHLTTACNFPIMNVFLDMERGVLGC
jgi:hypothetical protein